MRLFDAGAGDRPREVSSRIATVPNAITLARILALPFILVDLVDGRHGRALVLLAVFSFTDWVDGYLARRLDQVSRVGELLDPIADRALFAVVGVGAVLGGLLPVWAVAVVVLRDLAVLVVGGIMLARGASPPAVTRLGKTATFVLMVALPLFLAASVLGEGPTAPHRAVQGAAWTMFAAGVVLYWASAVAYARTVRRSRTAPSSAAS